MLAPVIKHLVYTLSLTGYFCELLHFLRLKYDQILEAQFRIPATSDLATTEVKKEPDEEGAVEGDGKECMDAEEEPKKEVEDAEDEENCTAENEEMTKLGDDEEQDKSVGVVEKVMQRRLVLSGKRLLFHPFFDKHDRIEYAKEELDVGEVPEPRDPGTSELQRISTVDGFKETIKQLEKVTEIGLALFLNENNFFQEVSYLIISSEEAHYCIDVKELGEHLNLLAPICLDPKITKIMRRVPDCLWWFQEEQGLYMANVFDLSIGFAFVPDAFTRVNNALKKFKLKIDLSSVVRFAKHSAQPNLVSNNLYLLTWTHFNAYMYRVIKRSLLAQFGTQTYLKIKHAMDDFCKLQHVSRHEVSQGLLLHNLRLNQEVQKKALSELCIWRQNVAKAQNINPRKVLTYNKLIRLATLTSSDLSHIRSSAESKYVEQDMAEVSRILKGSICTTIYGRSFEYHITNRRNISQARANSGNTKPGNESSGGVKRNQSQTGPGGPSSAVKRQKLQQHKAPQGNLRSPQQQGGRGAFGRSGNVYPPKTSYNTNPKGSPQTSRGAYRSNGQNRGSFRDKRENSRGGGNFRNGSDNSRRDSGNFRGSRDGPGNTRDRSARFGDSRNRSSGFRGDGRSFSNRSSSGNFDRSSDSFSRNSRRDVWQSSGNSRPNVWATGNSAGNGSYSESFRNSSRNVGNDFGGSASRNFEQSPTDFGGNIDVETIIIGQKIQLLQEQLEVKRMRQMLNRFN